MSPLRILIIDDEKDARELVKYHLQSIGGVDIVGEADNGEDAVNMINKEEPDCILLDIEMPELSGMEVVNSIEHIPQIIFITAYNEYAVRAFEIHAVDYLLKPFEGERLKKAIDRVRSRLSNYEVDQQELIDMLKSLSEEKNHSFLRRIPVKTHLKTEYVDVNDIILLEATEQYVTIQTSNKNYLVRNSMDYFENRLNPKRFNRTHRSYIVSLSKVESIEQYSNKTSIIHLKGSFKAKLSQARKTLFEDRLRAI